MPWGRAVSGLLHPRFLRIVGGSIFILHGLNAGDKPQCMPPNRRCAQDAAADPASRFALVTGDPRAKVEDHLQLPQDSPLVNSLPFLEWTLDNGPPAKASAPRSKVVSALLQGTRRPTLLDLSRLEELAFISYEVTPYAASAWASELKAAKAFESVYSRFGDWASKVKDFTALATNPDNLLISEDSFEEVTAWSNNDGPSELAFLSRLSIADLINADMGLSDATFQPLCLARATLIMGSKDNQSERDDESSTVRLASELITGILKKEMRNNSPSASGMAARFAIMLRDVKLPSTFCMQGFNSKVALREFELGYNYARAGASELASIEAELFLNVSHTYPIFKPLMEKFSSGPEAAAQFNRLSVQLLSSVLASSANLVRLPALASLMEQASWRAAATHLLNTQPGASGSELVTALIRTHTDVAGSTSGGGGSDIAVVRPSGSAAEVASYGSIREQSIGDALRAKEATDALECAADLTGVERVEAIMQSNSVLLTRAELMQEAWLHNKNATLAFCSLDQPYLCPYFASVLTEDKTTGKTPERLASYVFPTSELAALRRPEWSKLQLLGQALKIRALQYGTSYTSVKDQEIYTVESCLRIIRDYGARLFFACNLGLAPAEGFAFTDGVDLQLESVEFARSLPRAECAEWLTFLTTQFKTNWLDAGGLHFHSKLRSGRPDSAEAQLSEFLPLNNAFHSNVKARMQRAHPVAEFRLAFPTMFSADKVSLPGTSAASSNSNNTSSSNTNNKGTGKGAGKGEGKRPFFEPGASGPGSKSKLARSLSSTELWLGGVVFQLDKISKHYNINNSDHLCWPVLLTKKKGADALEICPDHATHGDLKQAVHKRPANLDLDYIYKHFTRGATSDENKSAGWEKSKKKKN